MNITWTDEKAALNKEKHGLSFPTAQHVFADEWRTSRYQGWVNNEERWQTVGLVRGVYLFVAHTWTFDDDEEYIQIISARLATAIERKNYEAGTF